MAYNEYGNSIPAPGFSSGPRTGANEELLYSTVGYTQKGVTLKPGQGVLKRGTVLTQDPDTKQYVKYDSANHVEADEVEGTPESGAPKGLLRRTTDTGSSADGQVWQGNIVITGIVRRDYVLDANSEDIVDLVAGGTHVLGNVTQDADRNFIKF